MSYLKNHKLWSVKFLARTPTLIHLRLGVRNVRLRYLYLNRPDLFKVFAHWFKTL